MNFSKKFHKPLQFVYSLSQWKMGGCLRNSGVLQGILQKWQKYQKLQISKISQTIVQNDPGNSFRVSSAIPPKISLGFFFEFLMVLYDVWRVHSIGTLPRINSWITCQILTEVATTYIRQKILNKILKKGSKNTSGVSSKNSSRRN